MAVLDGTWWSAWWGPMTWWLLALAGLLVLAGRALRRGLARLGRTAADPAYLPLYLDNDAVMGLFKMQRAHLRDRPAAVRAAPGRRPGGGPAAARLRDEGQFQAHCLGKVTSWDPDAREVVLQYPVAVFR
ncbi:hypothetical protein [Streptomyces eurythermus]|uniref:hypothetical protein n=2 Tax=Streptomyces eurythermus TaxID=42237 RepID=UPI0033F993D2